MNELQKYIKAYKESTYGKEVKGTTELIDEASQILIKIVHRVVLLEIQFIDGMYVNYQKNDKMDSIECPMCKYKVAINEDCVEVRPKHCPECGTRLIY